MATDALLSLTGGALKTVTATTNENPVNLRGRAPIRKPLYARIRYYAARNASGANSVTFSIQDQDPTGTYRDRSVALPIDLTTVAKSGILFVDLIGLAGNRISSANNVRLVATVAGAGSTPTISYSAELAESQG